MDFPAIMTRIQAVAGTRTQVELAAVLGIRQSSISDAKCRGRIPDAWLISLLEQFGANPGWIKTGEGPRYLTGDVTLSDAADIPPEQKPAAVEPDVPEPTVAELKAALEARLGDGIRIMLVGADELVMFSRLGPIRGGGHDGPLVLDEPAFLGMGESRLQEFERALCEARSEKQTGREMLPACGQTAESRDE